MTTGFRASRLAVWSWVLYDFANTIFSISILSFFFPLWVDEEIGNGGWLVNSAVAVSALLVLCTAPVLGAMADFRQRRVPYLVVLTVISVFMTAGLGVSGGVVVGVALFVAADLTYQSALVFYNALLPVVAAGRGDGRISGYGTAAGYVGSIFALLVLTVFVDQAGAVHSLMGPLGGWIEISGENSSNAFLPTAVLYLLFSLPVFFFVPDPAVRAPRPVSLGIAYRDVVRTLKNLRRYAGVGTFIIATILYTDAANTAISNMALYGRKVFDMDSGEIRNLLLFSTVFAVVGSTICGFATDRYGPKRTLLAVLGLWLVSIALAAAALGPWMLYLAGPLVGIALGGTWTVSRVMLIALSPPEKLGEFFGLFSLAGKVSAVTGPALTAILLFVLDGLGGLAYRISIASLSLIMALGVYFLLRVPDVRPGESGAGYEEDAVREQAGTVDTSA
ncbi:MAG TPA: MFS transporter [Rubrobacteraceae bacterium]|nr:MFS transporter [Rubrobacteraceae bacterium]